MYTINGLTTKGEQISVILGGVYQGVSVSGQYVERIILGLDENGGLSDISLIPKDSEHLALKSNGYIELEEGVGGNANIGKIVEVTIQDGKIVGAERVNTNTVNRKQTDERRFVERLPNMFLATFPGNTSFDSMSKSTLIGYFTPEGLEGLVRDSIELNFPPELHDRMLQMLTEPQEAFIQQANIELKLNNK